MESLEENLTRRVGDESDGEELRLRSPKVGGDSQMNPAFSISPDSCSLLQTMRLMSEINFTFFFFSNYYPVPDAGSDSGSGRTHTETSHSHNIIIDFLLHHLLYHIATSTSDSSPHSIIAIFISSVTTTFRIYSIAFYSIICSSLSLLLSIAILPPLPLPWPLLESPIVSTSASSFLFPRLLLLPKLLLLLLESPLSSLSCFAALLRAP
ncbi:hypothetical protein CRG98_024743 [Punica granatum]|uniref:Uncharacterized protein n=1 Tax=Punica granatum TaxID=22663 RepID=A0A2I0JG35_PUNGR|nr:hypothetical protein CRG98_024743 [Punica granatum]